LVSSINCVSSPTNQYRHVILDQSQSPVALQSTSDITWQSNVVTGNSRTLDTQLTMPCVGSGGVGATISIPITITAIIVE
jgi:hypothetical protein